MADRTYVTVKVSTGDPIARNGAARTLGEADDSGASSLRYGSCRLRPWPIPTLGSDLHYAELGCERELS